MTLDDIASPGYRAVLNETHGSTGWGSGGKYHGRTVVDYAHELDARTVLDYGCGKNLLAPAIVALTSALEVHGFDPGVPGLDAMPAPADLVVATDVLEHVEEK